MRRLPLYFATLAVFLAWPGRAGAQTIIAGFGNGAGFAFNTNGTLPLLSGGVLTITQGGFSETRSVFFQLPLNIGQFTAQFTYQGTPGFGMADGIAFVLQNDPRGANALSDGGTGLGYGTQGAAASISPSFAFEINIYAGHVIGAGIAQNGTVGSYQPTGPVAVNSGHPIQVAMNYNGSNLQVTMTDLITTLQFNATYAVNLPVLLGGSTAYIGFTGATGGETATQTISNFSYAAVPEPGTLALMGTGLALAALAWARRTRRPA